MRLTDCLKIPSSHSTLVGMNFGTVVYCGARGREDGETGRWEDGKLTGWRRRRHCPEFHKRKDKKDAMPAPVLTMAKRFLLNGCFQAYRFVVSVSVYLCTWYASYTVVYGLVITYCVGSGW